MQYRKYSLKTINAFLRKEGVDTEKFISAAEGPRLRKLSRPQKRRIEELAGAGKRVLVYLKRTGRFVIKDESAKFNFEKPEIRAKAKRVMEEALKNG